MWNKHKESLWYMRNNSWFCAHLMKARGQGVIMLWQMSCIFQYFILQRKTRKINDAQATSGALNWDGQQGNQITDLSPASSQNQILWPRLKLLSCHDTWETTLGAKFCLLVSRDRNSNLGEIRLARSNLSWKCVAGSSQTEYNPQKPFDSLAQEDQN